MNDNPVLRAWIESGQGELETLRTPAWWDSSDAYEKYIKPRSAAYWLNRDIYPVKTIFPPGVLRRVANNAFSIENFYKTIAGDTLHRLWRKVVNVVEK